MLCTHAVPLVAFLRRALRSLRAQADPRHLGPGGRFRLLHHGHRTERCVALRRSHALGIASANATAASAYVADVTPPEKRAAAFGMLGAAFGLGFILGPLFGGLLGMVGPRVPFWAAAAMSLGKRTFRRLRRARIPQARTSLGLCVEPRQSDRSVSSACREPRATEPRRVDVRQHARGPRDAEQLGAVRDLSLRLERHSDRPLAGRRRLYRR